MKSLKRQKGVSFALVGVVLVLVIVGILATRGLSRLLLQNRGEARVPEQFQAAQQALAQFVATSGRLPCPADPALPETDANEGAAVPDAATTACTHAQGTLPWKTIGLARENAVDPWGHKLSYRVFAGPTGLTQNGGASMVECDTSGTAAATAAGLCTPNTKVTLRDTSPDNFLLGKGFAVSDMGTSRTGVAYVLISHGATGRGGYTTSGVRREMPLDVELANTSDAGATSTVCPSSPCFVVRSFSEPGADPAGAAHFDDYVSYRTIPDLIRAAGLSARDWPEELETSVTFNQAIVDTAVGTPVTPGAAQGVGQVTVTFTGVVATGSAGGTAANISFDVILGTGGLGVAGGGSALLESGASETLRFEFERGSQLGITLNDFGTYSSGNFREVAEFRFYLSGVQVGSTWRGVGCRADGGLGSFIITPGTMFDRVDVTSAPALNPSDNPSGVSAFLVSEIRVCPTATPVCHTPLSTVANECTASAI